MTYTQTLIDKAAETCGSRYKLAKKIGLAESTISSCRVGRRKLPLKYIGVLSDLAHVDAVDALARVVAEQAPGTDAGMVLKEILGKGLAAGVAAMSLFFYSADWNSANAMTPKFSIEINNTAHRIKWRRFKAWLSRLGLAPHMA